MSLPAASKFGVILTLDLKEVKIGPYKYIFRMIDGFTRYTVSIFLKDKKAKTICSVMMSSWLATF